MLTAADKANAISMLGLNPAASDAEIEAAIGGLTAQAAAYMDQPYAGTTPTFNVQTATGPYADFFNGGALTLGNGQTVTPFKAEYKAPTSAFDGYDSVYSNVDIPGMGSVGVPITSGGQNAVNQQYIPGTDLYNNTVNFLSNTRGNGNGGMATDKNYFSGTPTGVTYNPGTTYRLTDPATGAVLGTANDRAGLQALSAQALGLADTQGTKANYALQSSTDGQTFSDAGVGYHYDPETVGSALLKALPYGVAMMLAPYAVGQIGAALGGAGGAAGGAAAGAAGGISGGLTGTLAGSLGAELAAGTLAAPAIGGGVLAGGLGAAGAGLGAAGAGGLGALAGDIIVTAPAVGAGLGTTGALALGGATAGAAAGALGGGSASGASGGVSGSQGSSGLSGNAAGDTLGVAPEVATPDIIVPGNIAGGLGGLTPIETGALLGGAGAGGVAGLLNTGGASVSNPGVGNALSPPEVVPGSDIVVTGNPGAAIANPLPLTPIETGTLLGGAGGVGTLLETGGASVSTPPPGSELSTATGTGAAAGGASVLDKLRSALTAAGLTTRAIDALLGGGSGGSSNPAMWNGGNPQLSGVFSAQLPPAKIPGTGGASSLAARQMPAQDWNTYATRPEQSFFNYVPQARAPHMAPGAQELDHKAAGGLAVKGRPTPRAVAGPGTGRSDSIPSMLSDGEYVVDAETVALLGDGSNKAGADKLDQFRVKVRQHKGKQLAKGKFSLSAKSPEAYMAGGRT